MRKSTACSVLTAHCCSTASRRERTLPSQSNHEKLVRLPHLSHPGTRPPSLTWKTTRARVYPQILRNGTSMQLPRYTVSMRWLTGFLIAIALPCAAQTSAPASKAKQLSAGELKELLEKKDVFFLDVREPKELEELGTIKGYINIPLGQLESRLSEIPKSKLIITACNHGSRAARAVDILEKGHYKTLGACGLAEWKEKNYPLIYPKQSDKK